MYFIIFFIPEAFFCLLGGIALTTALGIGQASHSMSVWIVEHYQVIVWITIGLALIVACIYAKLTNIISATAGLFAISSPLCLLLDAMLEIFFEVIAGGGNGWLVLLITMPILIFYLVLHGIVLMIGFLKNIENGNSIVLWLLGVAGWIITTVLFG